MNVKRIAEEEKQRLTSLLFDCGVNEKKIEMMEPLIRNTAWMKAELDDTRDKIKKTSVVIPYDNGGGQTGIRENPLFKGYMNLWSAYMSGMKIILSSLPQGAAVKDVDQADSPKTVLQIVRDRHKKNA